MPDQSETHRSVDFRRVVGFACFVGILLLLFWAKDFLLPVVLAALIGFLLIPVVSRLERWGLHPILAVLGVVISALILIGGLCAILSFETLNLVNSLPRYRENITAKWSAIQKRPSGPLNTAFRNIGDLANDLSKMSAGSERTEPGTPMKVQIVSGADSALALARQGMAPVFGPLSEFAVIAVLVVFILFERKQFRGRFLRLIGYSHIVTTTLAVDEAGSRLSSFLLMQLAVNSGYAMAVAIGLYFIGIPNAILWAVLTLVLRFLPYIGLWISAFFPLVLSVAISTSWTPPVLTLLLYVILEVFTNNAIEPFVLGGSTGMSPLAVIVSALFWTWLWGPVGLLLSTPITSCLVVLGRYFPAFHPYSVLLAADPPTSSETKLIRLLTESRLAEAKALVHGLTAMELSARTAEEILVPAVRTIENELFPGATASQTKGQIYEQLREVLSELTVTAPKEMEVQTGSPAPEAPQLVIVPFIGEGDEVIARVLARLLEASSIPCEVLSWRTLRSEKVSRLKELGARHVLFSVVESRSTAAVARMIRSIQGSLPGTVFMVGLWSLPLTGGARLTRRIREVAPGGVCTNVEQAVETIVSLVPQRVSTPDPELKLAQNETKH